MPTMTYNLYDRGDEYRLMGHLTLGLLRDIYTDLDTDAMFEDLLRDGRHDFTQDGGHELRITRGDNG